MKSFLLIWAFSFGFLSTALADGIGGILVVVKGDIKVTSGAMTEAAKVGRKVIAGDTITSGPDSRAKIVMADKNILNVSPDSKVKIETYTNDPKTDSRNVELKVEYGKVRASVEQKYDGEKNKFNVQTPTAVAGVRGTDFITGYDRSTKQSSVLTFSGVVAVGTRGPQGQIQNPVFVRPGQSTSVGQDKAPEAPKAIPAEDLNKAKSESGGSAPAATAAKEVATASSAVAANAAASSSIPSSASSSTAPARDPASAPAGPSMFSPQDLPAAPPATVAPAIPMAPPVVSVPKPIPTPPPIVSAITSSGKSHTTISITLPK